MSAAALAVMAGHAFPVFLKFHGGKAVASFVGAFLYLTPLPLAAVLVVFVVVVAGTRYISLGSIVAAAVLPAGGLADLASARAGGAGRGGVGGAFIIWRHQQNIARLRAGNGTRSRWEAGNP